MRVLVLFAAMVASTSLAAEPTHASLRKSFERNAHTLVRVFGPRASGPGVIVGAEGQVLTSVEYVGLERAEVELEGVRRAARVLIADAYEGIALVQLEGATRAAPAQLKPVRRGQTLVAIRWRGARPAPLVVSVKRIPKDRPGQFDLSRAVPNGTPIFDDAQKLLGVVVKSRRVMPLSRLKQKLGADPG